VFLLSESTPPACAVDTLATEVAARQREELNALYVAVTRAKTTLVISSIEPYRAAPNSWWQRLQGMADDQDVTAATPAKGEAESSTFALPDLPALPTFVTNTSPLPKPDAALDTLIARIGKAMHRLLEFNDLSDSAVSRVAREFGLNADQAAEAQATASRIRFGDGAWAWDDAVVRWQGNEVELNHQGEIFRLDRLVQRNDAGHSGDWWVLDYKSAASPQHQADLVKKMRIYIAALKAIYPSQTVRAAFLTGDGKVVQVH
jgi:ATP-dependent helicase/nuclease subunit A